MSNKPIYETPVCSQCDMCVEGVLCFNADETETFGGLEDFNW